MLRTLRDPPPKGHRRSQSFTLEGSRSLPRLSRERPSLDARVSRCLLANRDLLDCLGAGASLYCWVPNTGALLA